MNYLKNGHICVRILGIKDHKFEWCQQDICEKRIMRENALKTNSKEMSLTKELEEKGHTCISYRETFPIQVSWREQEICKNKK